MVTLGAVAIALVLGATRHPFVQYLRPVGEFYVAILQMCVLPFLLATIPLAVRSAVLSGTAGHVMRSLITILAGTIVVVALIGVLVPTVVFHLFPLDDHTLAKIGALVGGSSDRMDVEFAIGTALAEPTKQLGETGILAVVPTNIFAALSRNDSVRVLIFAAIFGIGMVVSERHSGISVFGALRHIQQVCILIFDWFNLLVPIGIVALIAPQVALLGSEVYVVLALFSYAFLGSSILILGGVVVFTAASLRMNLRAVSTSLLRPIMLGAATRNSLVCIPLALETMTKELQVPREPCELYIPLGFATIRFGTILYFAIATIFVGTLLGHTFGVWDLALIAGLSIIASFATLGLTGIAALAPLAIVLRPLGLPYEIAVPLLSIVDPIAFMIRVMINVAVNCLIPALATRRQLPVRDPVPVPAE